MVIEEHPDLITLNTLVNGKIARAMLDIAATIKDRDSQNLYWMSQLARFKDAMERNS